MTRRYIIFGILGGFVIFLFLAATGILPFGGQDTPGRSEKAILAFWGFKETRDVWKEIITKFEDANPHIKISYTQINPSSYEDILINRIAEGKGPDVFMLTGEQIMKHRDKIFPLPQAAFQFSADELRRLFVDGFGRDLILEDGSIIGLPLFMDSLALFYNRDLFNTAGIADPAGKTWDEILAQADRLNITTPFGDITRSAIAFGVARNVDNAFEIVSAMMLQKGEVIVRRDTKKTSLGRGSFDAFDFYTGFANPSKPQFSWTFRLPRSLDAFAAGKTAMVAGFARDVERVRSKNAHLGFGVVPLPQQKDAPIAITYGSYHFPTVSFLSRNRGIAWQFILFLASREASEIYAKKTGLPPARRDLISALTPAPPADVFYRQALSARSWPVPDAIQTRKIFNDAIDSVAAGNATPPEAVNRIRTQLDTLLER
ncbi:MAG: extracellular solute-binding protein [Patescibacteria group bacterium]